MEFTLKTHKDINEAIRVLGRSRQSICDFAFNQRATVEFRRKFRRRIGIRG